LIVLPFFAPKHALLLPEFPAIHPLTGTFPMHLLRYLRLMLVGFVMGAADLVPGVSGGTIAFICGIYDRFINGIKAFDLEALRMALRFDWRGLNQKLPIPFFLALGTGLLTAIFSLSHLLSQLFVTHPIQLWSLFFGLVLGSILLLAHDTWVWRPLDWIAFVVAALATYWLVGLPVTQTPPTLPFVFMAGAIAICAMILPGISGSYLLVIMGKYQQILEAVSTRDFLTLSVFIAGIGAGVLSFVRVVSWLLRTYRHVTLVALTGIMAGALRTVWPWKSVISTRINSKGVEVPVQEINVLPTDTSQIPLSLGLLLVGAALVLLLARIAAPSDKTA
jgi:putative membrane protein